MAWKGDNKTWVAGCDKLLTFFEKEWQKAIKKNEESKAKKWAKWQSLLDNYKSEDEINDAYGYEMITEKERQDLLARLAAGEENVMSLDATDAYIYLLQGFMSDLNKERECIIEELKDGET